MFLTGSSSRLGGGLGSAAKVAIATAAAVLTMTATAAALVLPSSGGGGDGSVTVDSGAGVSTGAPATDASGAAAGADVQAGAETSASTPGASTSTATQAAGGIAADAPTPAELPSLPLPTTPNVGGALPDLSSLANIPNQVMACVQPAFDLLKSMPSMPSMSELTGLGPKIVSCVTGIVSNLPLPFGMNACISSIMGFVNNVMSNPMAIPDIGSLNVAACIPNGLPVPTGLPSFMGGGSPFHH